MPVDPSISLALKPSVPLADPLEQASRVLQIRSQLQQGQLGAQQLQEGALGLQQKQLSLDQTQAMNRAYHDALTIGADGSADIDTGKLTNSLATAGHGSAIPGVLEGVTKYKKAVADLAETTGKVSELQANAAGALGATLVDAKNDPQLFLTLGQHAVNAKSVDPKLMQPLLDQVSQSLTTDPSGESARQIVAGIAQHFITGSAEQQKQLAATTAANARASTAKTAADKFDMEKSGISADNLAKGLKVAAQTVPNNQADWNTWRGSLPPAVAVNISPMYTPAEATRVQQLGMSPDQQVTTTQTATRDAATQADRKVTQGQGAQRIGIEAARLNLERQKMGGSLEQLNPAQLATAQKLASGDMNPTLLARYPDKEAIMAGAISINPDWTSQTYATKRAFQDPQSRQSQNLGTISRIVGHIGRFEQNSKEIGLAPAFAAGMNLTGAQNKLNDDVKAIASELEKLVSGGVGTEGQVKDWQQALKSPFVEARQESIDEISRLIGSQYEGMSQTYKTGTGSDLPVEKYISPAGRAWMKAKGINVGGGAAPVATPAAGGAPTPATQAEFNALPKGASFMKPNDPTVYTKK